MYGTHTHIAQNMLDYDYLCDRWPSIAAFFSSWSSWKKHKLMYGNKEICIPTIHSWEEAKTYTQVDTLINLASFRSCTAVNKEALATGMFDQIFTIAEWVAERETRELIALAKGTKTSMFGPSTVGWIICGTYKIGHTAGSLDNILTSKLYRPWSVGIVSKSGSMMNEFMRVVSKHSDGTHSAFQVGGDRFPMVTFADIVSYFETVDAIKTIVLLGEVGNKNEIEIADMITSWAITKPVVVRCMGSSAEHLSSDIQFGHAWAKANGEIEQASYKNEYLRKAWAYVPESYDSFGEMIEHVHTTVHWGTVDTSRDIPEAIQAKLHILETRKKTNFTSTISDERGDELLYNGIPLSTFIKEQSLAKVIGHLWLKRELPDYAAEFLTTALILLADHGPAVSGAQNTIITARSGKDLVSSLIAWLATIWPRFGWAIDGAALWLQDALTSWKTPLDVIKEHKSQGKYIQWIGHKVKSKYNPDKRCQLLEVFAQTFPATPHFTFAKQVESYTLEKKPQLILNVDGHIAALLLDIMADIGMSEKEIQQYVKAGLFNGVFVLARSIWFIGHYLDQQRLNEGLYRAPWDDIAYM